MKFLKIILYLLLLFLISGINACSQKKFKENEIHFKNPTDNAYLSGTISLPNAKTSVPAVVLVHGSGAHTRDLVISGKHKVFKDLAQHLANNGIAVLRYDKRGVGKSEGQYNPYDLESFIGDGLAGVNYLKNIKAINHNKIGVIGISQGAIIAPMMAIQNKDINFIVMLAGSGVNAYELFYTSQMAISKAAGYTGSDLTKVSKLYNAFWEIISKKEISAEEIDKGILYLKLIWGYIDMESRQDFGFLEHNIEFMFEYMYHHPNVVDYFQYKPSVTLEQITCPVLAINGDKDVQVVADINLPAIKTSLEAGKCKNYKIVKLKNHNHIFQKCQSGKISEYKEIKGTISIETLDLIVDWINKMKAE